MREKLSQLVTRLESSEDRGLAVKLWVVYLGVAAVGAALAVVLMLGYVEQRLYEQNTLHQQERAHLLDIIRNRLPELASKANEAAETAKEAAQDAKAAVQEGAYAGER